MVQWQGRHREEPRHHHLQDQGLPRLNMIVSAIITSTEFFLNFCSFISGQDNLWKIKCQARCYRQSIAEGLKYNNIMSTVSDPGPRILCKLSLLLLLLALISLTRQANYYPLRAPYWGSYQFRVAYVNGSNMVGTTPYLYFSVPFTTAVSNILEMSVVLSSYQLATFNDFLFRVTRPTFNSALQSATFGVQVVSPSSFGYFRFFVVYNTQLSANFFEINVANVTCSVANGAAGTAKTETLTSITRLHVAASDTVSVQPVLSSILLYNSNLAMQFALTLPATPVSNYTLSVRLGTTSSVTEIIITTFIRKTNLVLAEYVFHSDTTISIGSSGTISTLCTNNFNIPTKNGPQLFNQNCSVAVNSLQDNIAGSARTITFDATVSGIPAFTSCAHSAVGGVMTLGFSVFCSYQAVCTSPNEYYLPSNASGNTCSLCTDLTALCVTCNMSACLTCSTGYYPLNNGNITCPVCTQTNCSLCLSVSLCGACYNTSYLINGSCVTCTLINRCVLCSTNTTCLSCIDGYGPDPTGVCQLCNAMMPQCSICQSYYSCSQCNANYYVAPGGSSCVSCSFNISNCASCSNSYNCTGCSTGYYLLNNSACISCQQTVPNCGVCSNNGTCTQCVIGMYLVNATCLACTIPGCYNCTSSSVCVQCNLGYYIDASNGCTACDDPHCASCNTSLYCQVCDSDYNLSNNNTDCVCKQGWVVTGVCINVIGCLTAVKVGNVSTCLFCDSVNNFVVISGGCYCRTGYKQSGSACLTVCGDGLTITPEQCDDGNTDSGDGCSSTCTLQPNYLCGYNGTIYKCIFTSNFSISLQYIYRHETQNSATYYFTISPTSLNFGKMNLASYITISLPSTAYTVSSVSYSQGTLSVDVSFTADIEGLSAVLNVNFDNTYFNATNTTYPFISSGTNQPLIVSGYVAHLARLKIACYVILVLAGIIVILSSGYQKLIGIETVNVLQLVLFSKLLYIQNDLLISNQIINLKYIAGYNDIGQNYQHSNEVPMTYRRLLFNSDFILNFQTGLLLMVLSLIVCAILHVFKRRSLARLMITKKGNIDQYRLAEQEFRDRERFVYERVILMVACLCLFDCLAAIRLQSRILDGQRHYTYFFLNLVTMLFAVLYIFATLTYEILNVGKDHTWIAPFCSYSRYYIGYYLCYIIVLAPVLIGGEVFAGIDGIFLVISIVFVNLVITIIWRPYKQSFHNFALIFNNSVLLLVLGLSAAMKLTEVSEDIELIFAYVLLGLFFLIECFAFVRIIMARKPLPKEGQRFNKNAECEQDAKRGFENIEKDFLNQPQKKMKHSTLKAQEQAEALARLRARLKKQFKAKNLQEIPQL